MNVKEKNCRRAWEEIFITRAHIKGCLLYKIYATMSSICFGLFRDHQNSYIAGINSNPDMPTSQGSNNVSVNLLREITLKLLKEVNFKLL